MEGFYIQIVERANAGSGGKKSMDLVEGQRAVSKALRR